MHMPSESTVEFLVTDVVAPHFVAGPQLKRRNTATRLTDFDGVRERRTDSRATACGRHGNAIYGLRYAIPAGASFWVLILAAFQLFG